MADKHDIRVVDGFPSPTMKRLWLFGIMDQVELVGSAHASTASPSASFLTYAHCELWLLQSLTTFLGFPDGGVSDIRKGVGGGL